MKSFLYAQSEYNILENSIHLDDLVNKSALYGYDAVTLTDPNLHGAFKFLTKCKELNIKPILGLEIKISNNNFESNILGYSLNEEGYKSLVKISSESKINNKIYTLDELGNFDGLYFVSTFNDSEFLFAIKKGQNDFISLYNQYKKALKNNFGVGISLQSEKYYTEAKYMYDLCVENQFDAYPIHQTLYLNREDNIVYESLKKIGQKTNVLEGNYFLPTLSELDEEFFGYDYLFDNLTTLINRIEVYIPHVRISLPHFPNDKNLSSNEYLKELCLKGVKRRFEIEHVSSFDSYLDRLNYELNVISKMGYDDYFLIVWDYVKFAKKNGVMVGPGRGSACGSLVAYSLGITNVDPLKYNLLFERFLNPERVTMPDIDMDFPDDKRDFVINYVKEKYGAKRVCNISAFGTFQLKSSLRDLGKVMGLDSQRLNVLIKVASQAKDYDDLCEKFKDNQAILKLLTVAKKIENLPRHISTHAAGIILSEDPLDDLVPLQIGINNLYQAQWESYDLADIGLLKMDFLGIRNLQIVDSCTKEIEGLNNISIQYIPLNDKKTFELLQKGDTLGIFQLESEGLKKVLRKLKPTNINDIVAVLALYRPGPMEQIDEFIERKNGKKFEYLHKDLAPILKSTYGIIVYQEQIMLIAHDFAGLSLGEADLLRRAVSKKNKELLDSQRINFVLHCQKNNYSKEIANQIYDYIVQFANYGFNKSHAVGYALLSYEMAYLKANYFNIFMSKILNNVIGNQSEIVNYVHYAKLHNIEVFKPNINISTVEFSVYKKGLIFPLQGIFGIGTVLAKNIIAERQNGKFKSLDDFKKRVNINTNALEMLIYAGAFDDFGHSKKTLVEEANNNVSAYSQYLDDVIGISEDEYSEIELKRFELKALGFNIEYDSFKNIGILHKNYNAQFISRKYINYEITTLIQFDNIKELKTKKGDIMAVGNISDGRVQIDFVLFPKEYEIFKLVLDKESLFLAKGKLTFDAKYRKTQLQIEFLKKI